MAEGSGNQFGIQVSVDATKATAGSREFKRSTDDIASSARTAGTSIKELNKNLAEVGGGGAKEALESIEKSLNLLNTGLKALGIGAVVVEFKELFDVGKELEDAFIHLQVAADATEQEMGDLKNQTEELSDTFGKSQIDVATSQLQVAKAGFKDVADNIKVTSAALELSRTSFSDLGVATDLLTRIMQTYGAQANEAGKYSAELFALTRSGRLDVEQLNAVFGRSAQYIQASGLSFEEVTAALNGLTLSGINVQSHIQGFTQVLRDIAQPSDTAQDNFRSITGTLQKMGIEATTLKQLVGQQGLIGAFQTLVKVTNGNQSVLEKVLGNPQAAIVAIDLVNQGLKGYTKAIEDNKTAVQEQAEQDAKITASAAYQAETFRQKVQNAFIGLAGAALEALRPVFEFLNNHFEELKDAADAVAVILGSRLVVAVINSVAGFLGLAASQLAAAAAAKELAVADSELIASLALTSGATLAEDAALDGLVISETAAAESTTILGNAMKLLGGPIGILLSLLGGLTLAWIHYHDAAGRAKSSSTEFETAIAELQKHDTPENREIVLRKESELTDRKGSLESSISGLSTPRSPDTVDAGTLGEIKRKQDAGEKLAPDQQRLVDQMKGVLNDDELKKLAENKLALRVINEELEKISTIKQQIQEGKPIDLTVLTQDTDIPKLTARPNDAIRSKVDENETLANVYKKANDEGKKLHDVQDGLVDIDLGLTETVRGVTNSHSEQTRTAQLLRAEYYQLIDAQNQYNRQLDVASSKYDPIRAQTVAYAQELLKLKEAYGILGKQIDPTVKRQAEVANQQKQTTNEAKIQESVAPNSAVKAFEDTVATQSNTIIQANEYYREQKITLQQLQETYIASAIAIDKAAVSTRALTAGQTALANAEVATREAELKADVNGLQGEDRNQFLRESQVAQDDAARKADILGDRIVALAGSYDPLISIQKKYIDQLDEINSLERHATPEQKIQLEAARQLAPVQQKQDQDRALTLPAIDRTAIQAADTYDVTLTKLTHELHEGQINQSQFNQAALEAKQALDAADASFNAFTQAVIDGGKVMGDALEQYLIHPAEGLRGLFEQIAKGLQASAAGIVTKQLEQKAFSALANSDHPSLQKFGENLATGAGVNLIAKQPDLTKLEAQTAKQLPKTPEAGTLEAPTFTVPKVAGESTLSEDQLEAKALKAAPTVSPLETPEVAKGQELSGAATALSGSATDLGGAASALSSAASSLASISGTQGAAGAAGAAGGTTIVEEAAQAAPEGVSGSVPIASFVQPSLASTSNFDSLSPLGSNPVQNSPAQTSPVFAKDTSAATSFNALSGSDLPSAADSGTFAGLTAQNTEAGALNIGGSALATAAKGGDSKQVQASLVNSVVHQLITPKTLKTAFGGSNSSNTSVTNNLGDVDHFSTEAPTLNGAQVAGESSLSQDALQSAALDKSSGALAQQGGDLASSAASEAGTSINAISGAVDAAGLEASAAEQAFGSIGEEVAENAAEDIGEDLLEGIATEGYAMGGPVKAGQPAIVGEHGPELVTFGQSGHVHPNEQLRSAVGAAVNNKGSTVVPAPNVSVPVQIVNVSDPDDVPAGMATAKGGQAISNYISQNKTSVKSLLGV